MRRDLLALFGNMLVQRLSQLVDQRVGGHHAGEKRWERLDGTQHIVQQLNKHNGGTCRDPLAGECHCGGHKEHAELQDRSGNA